MIEKQRGQQQPNPKDIPSSTIAEARKPENAQHWCFLFFFCAFLILCRGTLVDAISGVLVGRALGGLHGRAHHASGRSAVVGVSFIGRCCLGAAGRIDGVVGATGAGGSLVLASGDEGLVVAGQYRSIVSWLEEDGKERLTSRYLAR